MAERKTYQLLDKKTVHKSYFRWMMYNLVATSYEFLEAFGFAYAMEPVLKKLYGKDPDKLKEALERHSVFYNTEPQLGAIVNGMTVGLEEQRALGAEGVTDDFITSLKVGLMGPLAGIGDSMIPGMLIPILLSIGMGLGAGGNILGPLFYMVAYNLIIVLGSRYLFYKGYELGADAVNLFVGEMAQNVTQAITVLGTIVTGGVAATYVKLPLPIKINMAHSTLDIQQILDNIFPSLAPLLLILISWYFMSKKHVSPIKLIIVYFILAFAGVGVEYIIKATI
ncbi:PTS system mannose/fructose/sorbose family transporter subunit IID [Sporolactobacillus sp. CQH2019]|uniref:PTS system mannose/fructose/sorbose family transporter subunit IID n=1 Tax=Sporolactobacillus sp. CQH2019 TaxID=3023512 RepID=UPI002368E2AA|nr:PTS system mannose/fructose/sorbose family transporter subunit IID [Sporolactobacillus sp. CQH2019]MDD9148903.1 PTS system mannose/fructose/sorbose family transporter subunit IID [Sporolactobacillus sp. CQH2019]